MAVLAVTWGGVFAEALFCLAGESDGSFPWAISWGSNMHSACFCVIQLTNSTQLFMGLLPYVRILLSADVHVCKWPVSPTGLLIELVVI